MIFAREVTIQDPFSAFQALLITITARIFTDGDFVFSVVILLSAQMPLHGRAYSKFFFVS